MPRLSHWAHREIWKERAVFPKLAEEGVILHNRSEYGALSFTELVARPSAFPAWSGGFAGIADAGLHAAHSPSSMVTTSSTWRARRQGAS